MRARETEESMTERILIVGAGHAAGQVVSTLMHRRFGGRITLVGEETSLPYQRPPLSKKFLSGELDVDRLLLRPASFYINPAISVHPGTRIASIDRARKIAISDSGETFPYDKLVLATGARPRTLDVPGAELEGVHYLRAIDDVERIRPALTAGKRLAIVGAGYIGLEVAAVAVGMGVSVTVIEAESRVLSRVVSPVVSDVYEAEHRKHGVELVLGAEVTDFAGEATLKSVQLADGRDIPADIAIIGIGAVPNTELAAQAGIEIANGIVVDDHCLTSDPDVYAVGDCTYHPNALLGRRLRLESVHNALEQAKTAAANLCGEDAAYADVPWFWSDQYDLKLQIAGLPEGDDQVVIRGNPEKRTFACLHLKKDRLIAIDAVNSPKDFMQARSLIAAGAALHTDRLADVGVSLRDLAY